MNLLRNLVFYICASVILSACGGGGGGEEKASCNVNQVSPLIRNWQGSGHRVLFIGDSIIAAFDAATRFPEYATMNQGIGGQCTEQVDARFSRDATGQGPEAIILEGGINDIIVNGLSSTKYMERDALAAKNAGFTVVVVGVYAPGPAAMQYASAVTKFNSDMLAFTAVNGITYIDNTLPGLTSGLSPDGVHPNSSGYDTLRTRIKAALPW